jgi:hypothetical protein
MVLLRFVGESFRCLLERSELRVPEVVEMATHGAQALEVHRVQAAVAVNSDLDQLCVAQHLQMLADDGLREPGGIGELADTQLNRADQT